MVKSLEDQTHTLQARPATPIVLPAERAREAAGLSLQQAARRLGCSPAYLRSIERRGGACLKLARRLGRLYSCSGNLFIYPPEYLALLSCPSGQGAVVGPSYASGGGEEPRREPIAVHVPRRRTSTRCRPTLVPLGGG